MAIVLREKGLKITVRYSFHYLLKNLKKIYIKVVPTKTHPFPEIQTIGDSHFFIIVTKLFKSHNFSCKFPLGLIRKENTNVI